MNLFRTIGYIAVENGALVGVLITAGLTYIIYNSAIKSKNVFRILEKYEKQNIKTISLLPSIAVNTNTNIKTGEREQELVYKNTKQEISEDDYFKISLFMNMLTEIGILYKKGLINRRLTLIYLSNFIQQIVENARDIVDFSEGFVQDKRILYLYEKVMANRKRGKQFFRIKKGLKDVFSNNK